MRFLDKERDVVILPLEVKFDRTGMIYSMIGYDEGSDPVVMGWNVYTKFDKIEVIDSEIFG